FGCKPIYYGIANDSAETILRTIKKAKDENELLLVTGGVSAGDLDLVPSLLEKAGYQIVFHGVGIQPGRPTLFGKSGTTYVFGIPGNPVAAFIVFEILVKELLAGMLDLVGYAKTVQCPLAVDVKRQKMHRLGWRPVKIIDGNAHPLEYHGTAHITSYVTADGIMPIPIGISEVKEGTIVEVRLI
ncbi:MAG TPA: molybdopterin-binding protein, partial [Bacteroidota bacterium]